MGWRQSWLISPKTTVDEISIAVVASDTLAHSRPASPLSRRRGLSPVKAHSRQHCQDDEMGQRTLNRIEGYETRKNLTLTCLVLERRFEAAHG